MIRAVLDTNVLVSVVLVPDSSLARILELWRKRAFVLLLSPLILEELREVLRYPRLRRRHGWSEEEIDAFADRLAETAVLTLDRMEVSAVPEDPDDDILLACALEGKADFLVTGDQHLLRMKEYQGIRIVTPAEFLQRLSV